MLELRLKKASRALRRANLEALSWILPAIRLISHAATKTAKSEEELELGSYGGAADDSSQSVRGARDECQPTMSQSPALYQALVSNSRDSESTLVGALHGLITCADSRMLMV